MLRKVYEEKDRQEEAIRASALDWTIVRLTVLTTNRLAVVSGR
jgi:uncharacterized protein YbjT (DUF2867 family)